MKLIHSFDLAALQNHLPNSEHAAINQYLLLDGSQQARLLRAVKKCGQPWISVFTQNSDGLEELMAVSPILVQFWLGNWPIMQALLEPCDGLPMVSLWQTPESLSQLAQRLEPWCVVDADGTFFNLRYPDTRRLRDLDALLNAEQRRQFYGPSKSCLIPDRLGKGWHELQMPDRSAEPAEKVVLDTIQTNALISAAEADEILYQLHFHSRIQPAVLADCHASTVQALEQADAQGIDDASQRMAACHSFIQSTFQKA